MDSNEINDHAIISNRQSADIFGNYYSRMFHIDTGACRKRLPAALKKNRGCNSEMLLKWAIDNEEVEVSKVPQSLFSFQRSVNMKLPDGSIKQCFHKYCQSQSEPLVLSKERSDMQKCSTIDLEELFAPDKIQRRI